MISGNSTAEAKVQGNAALKNGRLNYKSLKDHYEGVGVNSIDILQADTTLETLFYAGEKNTHMWLDKFESSLTTAFTVYARNEFRAVHSDAMKLRILLKKVNADFLCL